MSDDCKCKGSEEDRGGCSKSKANAKDCCKSGGGCCSSKSDDECNRSAKNAIGTFVVALAYPILLPVLFIADSISVLSKTYTPGGVRSANWFGEDAKV